MKLEDLIFPLDMEEFKRKYFNQIPLAIVRKNNPFENVLTLEEIETKLNDGVSSMIRVSVVDSIRMDPKQFYTFDHYQNGFALKKAMVRDYLAQNKSLIWYNMSEVNHSISELSKSIEEHFPHHHCDLHVYLSPSGSASKLNIHSDYPQQKLYLQLIGKTHWTVYDHKADCPREPNEKQIEQFLTPRFDVELTPGSVIYLPPGVFHGISPVPGTPRVSLSFPFAYDPNCPQVDRTHIDLVNLFQKNSAQDVTIVGDKGTAAPARAA